MAHEFRNSIFPLRKTVAMETCSQYGTGNHINESQQKENITFLWSQPQNFQRFDLEHELPLLAKGTIWDA